MIKYALICDQHHTFEGWFSNSGDFDAQKKRKLVSCPICNSLKVEKTLMAPQVSTTKARDKNLTPTPDHSLTATNSPTSAQYQQAIAEIRKMRDHVQANSENVGNKFPEEARKIHYGEADKRGIYGQASPNDVKELVEEGVEIMPFPELPEDKN